MYKYKIQLYSEEKIKNEYNLASHYSNLWQTLISPIQKSLFICLFIFALLPPCLNVSVMFFGKWWFYTRCNMIHTFERYHRMFSPKSWGGYKCFFFFVKFETGLFVLFGHQWISPCSSPTDDLSALCLFLIDESWTLILTMAGKHSVL